MNLLIANINTYLRVLLKMNRCVNFNYQQLYMDYRVLTLLYLALRAIKQLVFDEGNKFSLASTILSNSIYVDDLVTGASNC